MLDMRTQARVIWSVALATLVAMPLLSGCKGEYNSNAKTAPLVAAQRESTALDAFRTTFGENNEANAEEPIGDNSQPPSDDPNRPTLSWTPPLTRQNGESLYLSDIQGYRVYYRLRHNNTFTLVQISGADHTQLLLDGFQPGAYEFSVSVVDTHGMESPRSEAVSVDLI